VLLTRSRLCPGPKPGSSLHLHVLGTPPAFVLSQDQTLREELLRQLTRRTTTVHKESSKGSAPMERSSGPAYLACRPCALTREPDVHKGLRGADGVNLGTAVRIVPRTGRSGDGVEPGHTSRPKGRSRVRMLLSFQRPSHLFGRGFLSCGARPRATKQVAPERAAEYSARSRARRSVCPELLARAYDTTWTVTLRVRGRSSKSISTTCCQVPSMRRPSTSGIVSDGPISAARKWAWAFVS
jgi:hypothetical protein